MQNNYTLIIPNSISSAFRKATIPDFPSTIIVNPEDEVLCPVYSGCDFKVTLELYKENFEKNRLSFSDIKNFDTRFQHAIGCWLISKQAKQESRKVKGDIKELAVDILGWKQKIRSSDYKKIEINLKSLASIFYIVTFKKTNQKHSFQLIDELNYDESDCEFECILEKNVPTVIPSKGLIFGKPLSTYTSKKLKDIYPKQPRYKFYMRQYLAGIKNNPKDILQTRGNTLLEQFGYWADYKLGKKNYRNSESQKLILKYIKLAKTYGLEVSVTERIKDSKTISKKYYRTVVKRKHEEKNILPVEKEKFVTKLVRLIQLEPGCTDSEISRNKAIGLIKEHGFNAIKSAFDSKSILTFNDLEVVLEAGCED